jgi:hypothetical protein
MTVFGILMILTEQILGSMQSVLEEKLLKQHTSQYEPIPPLFLAGVEGVFGSILTISIALPICNAIPDNDHGSYENFKNSFYMLFHNNNILILVCLFTLITPFDNWIMFVYSRFLSATSRSFLDCFVDLLIWGLMVILYYAWSYQYGEAWTKYSFLQVCGFIMMILGTFIYHDICDISKRKIFSFFNMNNLPLLADSSPPID